MERLEEIKSRADLVGRGAQGRVTRLAVLTMLAALLAACQGPATPTERSLPAYLRLVPCGGEPQLQWSGSSEWRAVEAPIALDREARIVVEGSSGGRLCAADGSVLELASGSTIDVGPAQEASRLEMALREGELLFLALEPPYQFAAPGCLLSVVDAPTRFTVELNSDTTRLRVEEGRATCVTESDTITVGTCTEITAALGVEPQIGQYCIATPQPTPTPVTRSPTPVTPSPTPTDTPTPTLTPSITPTSTPTPTATRRVFIPTSTPTSPPPTSTPVPTSSGNGGPGDKPSPEPSPIP
jgi:hypothetical protein